MQDFDKYRNLDAYHWRRRYGPPLWRADPRLSSRYRIAARLLGEKTELRGSLGIDLGCGDGVMVREIGERGATIVGLEPDSHGLALAAECLSGCGLEPRLIQADAEAIPVASGTVDFVVCLELLEHLPEPHALLRESYRMLRQGGAFVLSTPQARPDGSVRDPFHHREYQWCELQDLLMPYFSEVEVTGICSGRLDKLYAGVTGFGLTDKCVRLGFHLFAALGVNPYELLVSRVPGRGYGTLVAVCRKQDPSLPESTREVGNIQE